MSREYEALVEITIRDPIGLKALPPVRIPVRFDAPEDPREMLSKIALKEALQHAELAERFMWL